MRCGWRRSGEWPGVGNCWSRAVRSWMPCTPSRRSIREKLPSRRPFTSGWRRSRGSAVWPRAPSASRRFPLPPREPLTNCFRWTPTACPCCARTCRDRFRPASTPDRPTGWRSSAGSACSSSSWVRSTRVRTTARINSSVPSWRCRPPCTGTAAPSTSCSPTTKGSSRSAAGVSRFTPTRTMKSAPCARRSSFAAISTRSASPRPSAWRRVRSSPACAAIVSAASTR